MTNDNVILCMGLMLGVFEVPVFFVMEVAEREKGNPSPLIMANTMNKQERRGEAPVNLTRNGIHHASRVYYSIEPEGRGICFSVGYARAI